MARTLTYRCSHWWHAPVYIVATVVLIIAAISLTFNPPSPFHDLISTLSHSGFHLTAIVLQHSNITTTPFTLFALPDSALSHLSSPAADHLLRLHTSPITLLFSSLSSLPRGTSLPSLLPNHTLTVSGSTINGIAISHPDLFVGGPHVVHGVAAAFPISFRFESVNWMRIAISVGARGYVSFAIGMVAVLVSLPPLEQVTVFAPRIRETQFDAFVSGERWELVNTIRRHIAVKRLGFYELAKMKSGEKIETIEKDWWLVISDGESRNINRAVVEVNGVEITEGEVYMDDRVVVHGVAMAFAGDTDTTLY